MKYKTYKDIEALKKRLIKNNGSKVECWDDWGIKVYGKVFKMEAYGDIHKTGLQYVIFRNKRTFEGIEIHYKLLKENPQSKSYNIFEFVEVF